MSGEKHASNSGGGSRNSGTHYGSSSRGGSNSALESDGHHQEKKQLFAEAKKLWEENVSDDAIPQEVWMEGVESHYQAMASLEDVQYVKDHPIWGQFVSDDMEKMKPQKRALVIVEKMLDAVKDQIGSVTKEEYAALFDKKKHQKDFEKVLSTISGARGQTIADIGLKKNRKYKEEALPADTQAELFEYKGKEKRAIDEEVQRRTEGKSAFWFVEPELHDRLYRSTLHPLKEGRELYAILNDLVDQAAIGNPDWHKMRIPHGAVVGVREIVEKIERKLASEPHNIGKHQLKQLGINLKDVFEDRFHTLMDQHISMGFDQINHIVKERASLFKKNCDPIKVADELVQDVYACARFDRRPHVIKDIESRLEKRPVDRVVVQTNPSVELGMDMTVTAAGVGISAISSIFGQQAHANSTPLQVAPNQTAEEYAEQEQKRKSRHARNVVFATVISVVGTAVTLDGLMFQGKYTKDIINRLRGGLGGGQSRS